MPGSSDAHIGDQHSAASRSEINSVVNCTVVAGIGGVGWEFAILVSAGVNIIFRQKVCGKI